MDGMGKKIKPRYFDSGYKYFAGGDGDLYDNQVLASGAHRDYVEGRSSRSKPGTRFIEMEGEFNPDEITEEDHKKYEKKCEDEQAEEASRRASDNNKEVDNQYAIERATAAATAAVKQTAINTFRKKQYKRNGPKLTLSALRNKKKHNTDSIHPSEMSFRGGRGGSRGGGGLKGATWEYDPDEKLQSKPSALFPPHPNLKRPKPATGKEKRQIKAQKKIQEDIRRGPLYTEPTKRDADAPAKTFSEAQFNSQYGSKGTADIDPFYGVETYSMKYAPKKRTIPQLSARPFNKELFPKELWEVLEGDAGEEVKNHINRIAEKKSLMLSDSKSNGTDEKTRIILEKIKNATGGGEDDAELDEDEDPAEEEEQDYDFEDDEDQMGGDYDGEKYFDNGEGDSGDEDNNAGGNDDY